MSVALFQFNNRTIPYKITLAPFGFDLVLLQGSQHTADFWLPVLKDFEKEPTAGGRLLTCDWANPDVEETRLAGDFLRLMQTLGMSAARVVAFDDAVEMVATAQRLAPGLFERTLFFPQGGPQGDELNRAVRQLCELPQ